MSLLERRQQPLPLTYDEAAAGVEGAWGNARAAVLQKEREADARKSLAFALAEAPSVH